MTTTVHLMFVFPLEFYISLKTSAGPSPRGFWSCSVCLYSSLEWTNALENAHITFSVWNPNLSQHCIEVRGALKIWTILFFNSPVPRNIPHTVGYHLYRDSCCKHTCDRQNLLNEFSEKISSQFLPAMMPFLQRPVPSSVQIWHDWCPSKCRHGCSLVTIPSSCHVLGFRSLPSIHQVMRQK